VRGAHECDALDAIEYAAKMRFGVISGEQDCFFADKAAQTMSNEDKMSRRRIAAGSLYRQIVQKVQSMVNQLI
jgi:hypothetical protein